jgi:hypothetical protein
MRVFLSRRIGRRNRIGVSLTPQEVLTAGKWYVITWAICIIPTAPLDYGPRGHAFASRAVRCERYAR